MWATRYSPASWRLIVGWAVFAVVNVALMVALPGSETTPFHFVWISLAILHGTRPLPMPGILLTLLVVTATTFWALLHNVRAGYIPIEETAEVPLMAGLFLVMVWNVNRRQASLRQVELLAAVERRRAEAQRLFVRLGSHELRTPITIARGYTELIRGAHPDADTDADTGIVLEELAKLEGITRRLLTLMLVDSAAAPTTVDLDEALERIVHRWAPTAHRDWRVESTIGSAAVNLDRLQTALDSLLENAVKFTVAQDVIELRGWRNNAEFFIEVHDTGRGIPPDELPYVFGHFATGRTAGEQAGTGLGLPIVRAAIEARGGTVTARSSQGEGTTFLIAIPDQVPDTPTATTPVDVVPEALQVGHRSAPRPLSPA